MAGPCRRRALGTERASRHRGSGRRPRYPSLSLLVVGSRSWRGPTSAVMVVAPQVKQLRTEYGPIRKEGVHGKVHLFRYRQGRDRGSRSRAPARRDRYEAATGGTLLLLVARR